MIDDEFVNELLTLANSVQASYRSAVDRGLVGVAESLRLSLWHLTTAVANLSTFVEVEEK